MARHISQYPPREYGFIRFNQDYALYILSQITLVPARNKEIADEMENRLTPLYSKLLQKVVRHYDKYLSYFVKTDIIYTDGSFKPGSIESRGRSRRYRFTDMYEPSDIVVVDYSRKFVKQLRKKRKEDFHQLQGEYGHLTKWLWPVCHLQINAPLAAEFLQVRREAQLNNPALIEKKLHRKLGYEIPKDPEMQYKHAMASVNCLVSGDIGCTVDGKVGRMHTVLTNIKSDLRHLITYRGKSLVTVDIKNSQPYLSTLLFEPSFWERQGPSTTTASKINISTLLQEESKEITDTSLILAHLNQVIDSQDLTIYIELVSARNGPHGQDLYLYMQQQSTNILGLDFSDRAKVKKGMFEVLFSKNSHYGKTKVKRLFKELFPSVNPLFELLKEGDNSRLPRLLQKLESHIVLKVITKAIHRKNKDIPLFTIHDSITTTDEYASVVEDIMQRELTRLIGLPPKLKVEPWRPDELDWEKYRDDVILESVA